jgi:hypothetical protein
MLMRGHRFHNLEDVLVHVRCGNGMQQRRGGLRYLREEIRLQQRFVKIGFLSKLQFVFNVATRTPIRLAPVVLRSMFYRAMLRDVRHLRSDTSIPAAPSVQVPQIEAR